MATYTCTICDKETDKNAPISAKCQKLDFPLHELLCTKITTFLASNPRPDDEYLSTHKLGILFPMNSKTPELIWVKNTIVFEEVGNIWDISLELGQYIETQTYPMVSTHDGYNIEVYISDNHRLRGDPNECLGHLLEGYQWTDGGNPISEPKWVGNVVVLRSRPYGKGDENDDTQSKVFEDITLADLRTALNYMGARALLYESEKENRYFIRDETKWVKGVKISCVGDMDILDKKQFRDVMVSRFHEIRTRPQQASTVSKHMDMTLLVFKCSYQKKVVDANNAGTTKRHPFDNSKASILMINANPEESNTGWGWADLSWDAGTEPTVLVVRRDKKPISAKQVELVVEYINQVVQWVMKPEEFDDGYEEMQKKVENDEITYDEFYDFETNHTEENRRKRIIKEYMESDRFEKFIEEFKKEQLAAGDTTWANVASPRAN